MLAFITRRLALSVVLLFAVSIALFVITKVVPSDPVVLYTGWQASAEEKARARITLGLDRPLPEQYFRTVAGFFTGDWGMPEGMSMEDMAPEEMLPPAEKLPTVESVAQAREMLAVDKSLALEMVEEAGEDTLQGKQVAPPWEPNDLAPMGSHFLGMVQHLAVHTSQLFSYLKLMGKPVNTGHLWGM